MAMVIGDGNELSGGAGDDVLVAVGNGNELFGGAGDDLLVAGGLGAAFFKNETHAGIYAERELRDSIGKLDEGAVLDGGAGDDILFGTFGNDVLIGGEGSDTFVYHLGEGGDRFVMDSFDTLDIRAGAGSYEDGGSVMFWDYTKEYSVNSEAAMGSDLVVDIIFDTANSLAEIGFIDKGFARDISTLKLDFEGGEMADAVIKIGNNEFTMSELMETGQEQDLSWRAETQEFGNVTDLALDQMSDALDVALEEAPSTGSPLEMATVETVEYALEDSDTDDLTA